MDPSLKDRLRKQFTKGTLFEEKYRIEGHLGTGSFAYVMLARHEAMDRRVALKVLKPDLVGANPELLERFVNEVKIVGKLKHPNTVTVFDYGRTDDGVHYLVMEYVEGVGLDEVLSEQQRLAPARVVNITQQILESLAEAHALGIVHRDLKPSNIMLTYSHDEKEIVKVLDFGVAKLMDRTPNGRKKTSARRSTQFIGTPVYMSPEQVLGQVVVPASDLYSLGLIVYEMLVGESPFENAGVAEIAQAHIQHGPLPLDLLPELSQEFQELIVRATSRSVDDRYPDVGAFARALPLIDSPSVEFSVLLADSEASTPAAHESSEVDFFEQFSGKNYLAPPSEVEDEEDDPMLAPTRPTRSDSLKPAQPERLTEEPEPRRASAAVELDVAAIKREELRQRREAVVAPPSRAPSFALREALWLLAGVVAAFVAFVVASTAWASGHGPDRWLLGLLPVGIALLWSRFAGIRRHLGSRMETVFVPAARHTVWTCLGLIAIVALISPEAAASKMQQAGAWFVADIPPESSLSFIRRGVEALAGGLAALFSAASKIVPWSG